LLTEIKTELNFMRRFLYIVGMIALPCIAIAEDKPVNLTAELPYVDIKHNKKIVRIQRNQDNASIIDLEFALTSRPCPPYCIQPAKIAEGVETIAEMEVIQYLQKISQGDSGIMVIDSREEKWLSQGMIPGAINIPWTELYNKSASQEKVIEILTLTFDVVKIGSLWNFENAKTLIFYCNGAWCGQSPTNIRALLNLGYPAKKIKWYRGGIQSWKSLGLTTVQGK
jgi:rhodanese-related sulfurtransferase